MSERGRLVRQRSASGIVRLPIRNVISSGFSRYRAQCGQAVRAPTLTKLSVAVQSGQQIADTQISENDKQKRDDGKVGGASARPSTRNSGVQKSGVSQPSD